MPVEATRQRLMSILAAVAIAVAACGGPATPTSESTIGGTVSVLGSWEGVEVDAFRAMVAPFEARNGTTVEYRFTRDLSGVIADGLATGDPPDIAGLDGPSHLVSLARAGSLVELRSSIDLGRYKAETVPAFVELGTVDGRVVGAFIKASLKGLIWYSPTTFRAAAPRRWSDLDATARTALMPGTRTWCVGLESGEASGWPGTDWIEDILLRQSGPTMYDDWVAGRLAWSSSAVRRAFEAFGLVVADQAVAGGAAGALATSFGDAPAGLFADPPTCLFHHQASFITSFFPPEAVGGQDYDFFPFPEVETRYAGSVIGGGDLLGVLRDTPQSRALIRYLVSAEAQAIRVGLGGALSGNITVRDYPDDLSRRLAAVLAGASRFRFDGSDAMPAAMSRAFLQAVLDFTADQRRLDAILAELDEVRATAYSQ